MGTLGTIGDFTYGGVGLVAGLLGGWAVASVRRGVLGGILGAAMGLAYNKMREDEEYAAYVASHPMERPEE